MGHLYLSAGRVKFTHYIMPVFSCCHFLATYVLTLYIARQHLSLTELVVISFINKDKMSKRRFMDAEDVKEALYTMSDGESAGGEISKTSWVGSASDSSSDSNQNIIFML